MAKVPPPKGKGEPPPPDETVGNLDKGEMKYLSFRVPAAFHDEFAIYAIQHKFKDQTKMLYAAFEALKEKYRQGW